VSALPSFTPADAVGPSGCGKSSLVNAAVVPLLDTDPAWLTVPTLVPGSDPLPELARALAATATGLGLGWLASDVRGRLEAGPDGLRRVADDLLTAGPGTQHQRLLVSIDQAEELFTRTVPVLVINHSSNRGLLTAAGIRRTDSYTATATVPPRHGGREERAHGIVIFRRPPAISASQRPCSAGLQPLAVLSS
jgi:Novel STAND NTPase 1